jgi:hypothetical protein
MGDGGYGSRISILRIGWRRGAERRILVSYISGSHGVADTNQFSNSDGLIPFTHWVTPPAMPKRFSTQMYLYMLPLEVPKAAIAGISSETEAVIPTPDGGVEHTSARFLPAHTWLSLGAAGKVIMFPPQVFLLTLLSQFLPLGPRTGVFCDVKEEGLVGWSGSGGDESRPSLQLQRDQIVKFINAGRWRDMVMSPRQLGMSKDGRGILGVDKGGRGKEVTGDPTRIVLVRVTKEGPREVEIRMKSEFAEIAKL